LLIQRITAFYKHNEAQSSHKKYAKTWLPQWEIFNSS